MWYYFTLTVIWHPAQLCVRERTYQFVLVWNGAVTGYLRYAPRGNLPLEIDYIPTFKPCPQADQIHTVIKSNWCNFHPVATEHCGSNFKSVILKHTSRKVNIGSGNGSVLWGNKPLPAPILIPIYVATVIPLTGQDKMTTILQATCQFHFLQWYFYILIHLNMFPRIRTTKQHQVR